MNLKAILAKDPASLTDAEKAFLREHASELSAEEKAKFADAFEEGVEIDKVVEALTLKFQKKAEEIAEGLTTKFLESVEAARAKALGGGDTKKKDEKADDATRKFLKMLFAGDKAGAKALTTSPSGSEPDDAQAGLLVPEELRAEVLRIAEDQYGVARREMFYLPFSGPGNSRKIPALGTSVSVFWTGETAKKTSTQPKFSIVEQTLKKLAAIVPMSEEILEDSAINLTQLVATLFAEAVAKEEDLQFFAGTGSPWTGILNNGSVNVVNQEYAGGISKLTADDLLSMIDETPAGALGGAKFYFNRTVLSVIRKLKDSNKQYIYQNPGQGQPATIWNYPYELVEAMPTAKTVEIGDPYIIFGNLKQGCIFGDKQQLRVKLLEEATITDTDGETEINLAEQDMVALRIVERVGYVVGLPKAITVLKASNEESS